MTERESNRMRAALVIFAGICVLATAAVVAAGYVLAAYVAGGLMILVGAWSAVIGLEKQS
jgi:hypothetical protein